MPILDRRTNQFIEDKDKRVSVGIDFPFARVPNQEGYFATTKTTIESVKNNIRLLLQTQRGERPFQPLLGQGGCCPWPRGRAWPDLAVALAVALAIVPERIPIDILSERYSHEMQREVATFRESKQTTPQRLLSLRNI